MWRVEALERKAVDQEREPVEVDQLARSLVNAWEAAERGEGDLHWRRSMLCLRDALASGVVVVARSDDDQEALDHDDFVDQVWSRHLERVGLT